MCGGGGGGGGTGGGGIVGEGKGVKDIISR